MHHPEDTMTIRFRRIRLTKRYPLRISRGVSTGSENLFVLAERDGVVGVGELAGTNTPGGETCDTGEAELSRLLDAGIDGLSITEIWQKGHDLGVRPRALAALDVALWDQLGKTAGLPLWRLFGLPATCVPTSVTIGINPPDVIRERVPEILTRTGAHFLKVKLGSPDGIDADKESFHAVLDATRGFTAGIRVDANGGWSVADARHMLKWLAERGVEYVEQPLPKGSEDGLPELFADRPLPIYVDESCDLSSDVPPLADRTDGVNLKLMKCGGLTEALRIVATARAHGLKTMIGCMGESSVSISAGASIGALFDAIDLDSHLNLLDDPAVGAALVNGVVCPNNSPGHGARLIDAQA
jgi:muconate cycloisomerase